MNKNKIVILGAGISGLATAHWLNKDGFDVKILEAQSQVGGAMQTIKEENFLIDFGPNSGLETTPLIRQIVEDVGLSKEMIYASEISNKRYILRNNKLYVLPMGLTPFIKTKLFSTKGKLRLFAEPFIGKSADGYYQSIAQFVERRLGREFLDYAIDPFVSGVFAGDPTQLSVKSAFPKLYRLEEIYGGLVKGMFKGARERKKRAEESKQSAKMFSFLNGMQTFPNAIAKTLEGKIVFDCNVKSVERRADKWQINYEIDGNANFVECDQIISTVPAYKASKIFSGLDHGLANHTNSLHYPPVMVLYVGFKKNDIGIPLDGFGFLIPSNEKKKFLGAIWSSTIFPNRCSEDNTAFTLFVGGARSPKLLDEEKETLINNALTEFKSIMNTKAEPVIVKSKMWTNAIPQYNIGYVEHENYFQKFESENPGIFLSGNYRGGISVGDCIKNSQENYKKVLKTME